MKAYELNLGDTFRQTSAPENLWKVTGLGTVKNGGHHWTGEVRRMGKTHQALVGGPLHEEFAATGRNMENFCAIHPNTNVELVEPGKDITPMRFGKHKGKPISEVPVDYLRWASENCWPNFDRQQLEFIRRQINGDGNI